MVFFFFFSPSFRNKEEEEEELRSGAVPIPRSFYLLLLLRFDFSLQRKRERESTIKADCRDLNIQFNSVCKGNYIHAHSVSLYFTDSVTVTVLLGITSFLFLFFCFSSPNSQNLSLYFCFWHFRPNFRALSGISFQLAFRGNSSCYYILILSLILIFSWIVVIWSLVLFQYSTNIVYTLH